MVKMNFGVPPLKKFNLGGVQIFFVKNETNQSCSKLPEMARKLAENYFFEFLAPPQKKLGGVHKFFVKNENCSELPEMARKLYFASTVCVWSWP